MTRLRVACLGAVLAGIAAGAAFALLHRQQAPAAVPIAGAMTGTPQPHFLPLGAPRDVRLSARTPDPGGGPPWVLRTFATRLLDDPLNPGIWRCVQAGRLEAGRFGWIAPGRAFRAVRFSDSDAPTACTAQRRLRRGAPWTGRFVLLSGSRSSESAPAATVTWGLLGRPLAAVRYSNGTRLVAGTGNAALDVRSGEVPTWATAVAVYRDGHLRRFHNSQERPGHFSLNGATVAARAPDPAGGPPWAILQPRTRRPGCIVGPGRLVGSHIGVVDPYLGIFRPDEQMIRRPGPGMVSLDSDTVPIFGCWQPSIRRPRKRPAAVSVLVSYRHDEDPVSRVQLRQPDGRTIIIAAARRNVASLQVNGRTMLPSGAAHIGMTVEPGTSPGAEFSVRVHLRDGSNLFWPLDVTTG